MGLNSFLSNTDNMKNPTIESPVKMEYGRNFNPNFWPKNDGEKWSKKNIFEIPPCGRLLSLTL